MEELKRTFGNDKSEPKPNVLYQHRSMGRRRWYVRQTWMGRLKLLQQQQANALINYVNVDMMAMIVNKTTYFLDAAS